MHVYVKSKSGKWLMPTNPANAGIMLKQKRARVVQRTPLVIQLMYETTGYVQSVTVGIDDGGTHIGIGAVSNGKVLFQQKLVLRQAISKTGYGAAISKEITSKILKKSINKSVYGK